MINESKKYINPNSFFILSTLLVKR